MDYVNFPDDPDNRKPNSRHALVLDPIRPDGRYAKDLGTRLLEADVPVILDFRDPS